MNLGERLRDPFTAGVLLGVGLVIAGFVTLGFAWSGVQRMVFVPLQLPYAISGTFAAIGLLGLGLGVLGVQTDRLHGARRKAALDRMVRDAAELIPLMRERHASGKTTSRVKE